jgi:hypothetical protein
MKTLDLDSSLAARKQLAKELTYTGDTNDSATMNVWLHKQIMAKLAANGGKLPPDIKTWLAIRTKSVVAGAKRWAFQEETMKRIILVVLIMSFAVGSAMAQSCATKAVSKDGKPLAGAAKTSFIKKCCEDSAVSKDGKPLSGAAKTSFVTKCEKGG